MEAQTRRTPRGRSNGNADDTKQAACSPLEESANALAGVEGAIGKPATPGKRGKNAQKATRKERSESIDQLISVAGSLLRDSTATAAAIAESNSTAKPPELPPVPNPIVLEQESTTLTYVSAAALPPPQVAKPKVVKAKTTTAKKRPDKKTQIQYNPDVPMTKEQLTSWRREMRRVRNRESAAASRRKVRDRIEELEEEVDIWKKRYEEAMARLTEAEARKQGSGGKSEDR